jgi:hypothetical protein
MANISFAKKVRRTTILLRQNKAIGYKREAIDQRGRSFADFRHERVFRNKKISIITKTGTEIVYLLNL